MEVHIYNSETKRSEPFEIAHSSVLEYFEANRMLYLVEYGNTEYIGITSKSDLTQINHLDVLAFDPLKNDLAEEISNDLYLLCLKVFMAFVDYYLSGYGIDSYKELDWALKSYFDESAHKLNLAMALSILQNSGLIQDSPSGKGWYLLVNL